MEDLSKLLVHERVERQNATQALVTGLLGEFLFRFSEFVTALHFCVAWHDWGENVERYGAIAEDLGTADLLSRINKQFQLKYGNDREVHAQYQRWLRKAHALRETRNTIMHSRWQIEPYGRHAVATSTPVFVEPQVEHEFSVEQLRKLRDSIYPLISDLSKLRHAHYL